MQGAESTRKSAEKRVAPPRAVSPDDTLQSAAMIAAAAAALFDGIISTRAPGAVEVARRALSYSRFGPDREVWEIGRDCLLLSTLAHGAANPDKTSAALRRWLISHQPEFFEAMTNYAPVQLQSTKSIAAELVRRSPTLSPAMANDVGPLARRFAAATIGRPDADLRHLLMALLAFPTKLWPPDMRDEDYRLLRHYIVEQIAAGPERGEKMEVWRAIADGTFDAPPAALEDDERTGFQTDEPALVDELDREGFADALVALIVQVQDKNRRDAETRNPGPDPNHAYMVHLDGPWGTGKSSVLNFVRGKLRDKHWLVVDYNAWKLQRLEPAWWTVITQIQKAALEQAPSWQVRLKLRIISQFSRLRFVGLPLLVGCAFLAVVVLYGGIKLYDTEGWKGVAGIVAAIGSLFAFSRTLVFGQSKALQTYESLRSDPYRPIMAHFELLFRSIRRPVIVLIDDLDRCDSANVVTLIESIQTMLRGVPILYLVAADRQWIRTSFEKKYSDFEHHAPDPGRPLGYLFLEKIFQVSTTLPAMSPAIKERYWKGLVAGPRGAAPADEGSPPPPPPSETAIEQAVAELLKHSTHASLQAGIVAQPDERIRRRLKRAAAEHLASPIVQQRTEGRLAQLPELMDANPRAMRRLLSAVTMTGARMMTEERAVSLEQIARWSALELRWPLLAMRLARYPDLLPAGDKASDSFAGTADPALDPMLADAAVKAVLGAPGVPGSLDRAALGKLLF